MTKRSGAIYNLTMPTVGTAHWEQASEAFRTFAQRCLTESRASRWCELLESLNPKQWRKIDPFELWDPARRRTGSNFAPLPGSLKDFASHLDPALDPGEWLFIFALGHSAPGLSVVTAEVANASPWPLEGVLLMQRRREAFVLNHDDELILLA